MQNQIQNDVKTAENIGLQFLQAYFGQNVDISNFYGNDSILTLESDVLIGKEDIVSKLKNLQVKTIPKNYSNGILIFFSGMCQLVGEENQMPFMRTIFLANSNGSYYVKNDIYKFTFA